MFSLPPLFLGPKPSGESQKKLFPSIEANANLPDKTTIRGKWMFGLQRGIHFRLTGEDGREEHPMDTDRLSQSHNQIFPDQHQ